MQKHVNLVDLVKSFPTNISLQNLASIRKRSSPIKFAHLAEKSGNGSISNLSTKAAITYQPFMTEHSYKAAFEEFMKKYEKAYKTAEEKATRFAIFVENRIYVHRANMEKDQTATFEYKFELTLSSDGFLSNCLSRI